MARDETSNTEPGGTSDNKTRNVHIYFKPKGFSVVVGLCIFIGAIGILSRTALWLSPFAKSLPPQLSAGSLTGITQTLFDVGYLVGGIYVLKKYNWARLLIIITAIAKILDWLYAANSTKWLFGVNKLLVMALPPLLIASVIALYFSRRSVKAYMN